MPVDLRLTGCMAAAAGMADRLGLRIQTAQLAALTLAVLAENDRHVSPTPPIAVPDTPHVYRVSDGSGRPDLVDTDPDDVVPGNAVWDSETRLFAFVDAAPVTTGPEVLVTYTDGVTAPFRRGDQVLVAVDTKAAERWNSGQVSPGPLADLDATWVDPDTGRAA